MTEAAVGFYRENASQWEKAMYAFLIEKERRSGSRRTVDGYSGMLRHPHQTFGKDAGPRDGPGRVRGAHGPGLSGKHPSSTTVGARIACCSCFYRFLIRM